MVDPSSVNDVVSASGELAERSAEERALNEYTRFLLCLAGKMGGIDAAKPKSWPQVFVPMRLGAEDPAIETFGNPQQPAEEELPGMNAWDLLGANDWLMITGRAGSGKTALVRAVIQELCSEKPSALRDKLQALPVPLIVRDLSKLNKVKTLSDLFDLFWAQVLPQAAAEGISLDRMCLESTLLFPATSKRPTLLVFDGIDKIKSNKALERWFRIARGARKLGYRVLITGRSEGFREIAWQARRGKKPYAKLWHLLPFAWPQIQLFMEQWYSHRAEWAVQGKEGVPRFLTQISHKGRRDLLVLARQPNLLELMAMVHCTENGPLGRAAHYSKIVGRYLERQRRHRQLSFQQRDEGCEFWPEPEMRQVLGYLALHGQHYRTQDGQGWEAANLRRIAARYEPIHLQLEGLRDFFLHPAGLVERSWDAFRFFVHLGIQEYLCACFLQEQFQPEDETYLQEELWSQLGRPGWQEVGLFFLHVHAEATNQQGHFELLAGLDLNDAEKAMLYAAALTDQELPLRHEERLERLPVAVAAALVHPARGLGGVLGSFEAWRQEFRATMLELLKAPQLEGVWSRLSGAGRQLDALQPRWLEPPNDLTWNVLWSVEEARTHSLLELASQVGFFTRHEVRNPIADAEFEVVLAEWLQQRLANEGSRLFWQSVQYGELPTEVPEATPASWTFDRLVPCEGPVFAVLAANMPAEVLVLQGEAADPEANYWDPFSQPSVLVFFAAAARSSPRIRFALSLYERVLRVEFAAEGGSFYAQDTLRSRSLVRSRSLTRVRSLSRSRSVLLSQSLARSRSMSRPRSLVRSRSMSRSHSLLPLRLLSASLPLGEALQEQVKTMIDLAEKLGVGVPQVAAIALSAAGYRFAARDYFVENGDPPAGLAERQTYVELGRTLESFEDFWGEVFGDQQVSPEERAILEADWNTLATRPWSPQALLAALMKDWREGETVRDVSWKATEKLVAEAVAASLAELALEAEAQQDEVRDRI